MAVKICAGSTCIECDAYGDTAKSVSERIARAKKADEMFFCCGGGCMVIDKITHVTREGGGHDDHDDTGGEGPDGRDPGVAITDLPVRITIERI